jgi:rhodanese-related sulfurtransferase
MKKIVVLFLSLVVIAQARAQSKEFVCTPCGLDCDRTIVHHEGSCKSCGMPLVEKASIGFKELSLNDVCARIAANKNLVLLDVRSPAEFAGTSNGHRGYGHFANAININIDELEGRLDELSKFKNEEVIVYCSHSHRSPRATYFLATHGFTNVSNMAGGVSTLMKKQENDCLKNTFLFH